MENALFKRKIINSLNKYIFNDDILVLHGARQVGKTSIMRYLESELSAQGETTAFIDLEDPRLLEILDQGVESFLGYLAEVGKGLPKIRPGKRLFAFIDEIQYLANPTAFLKIVADHYRPKLKLIVSGSSSFNIKKKFKNSLVGRTVNFEIFNLSFEEFLFFRNQAFEKGKTSSAKRTEELAGLYREYVFYGGYPKIVLTPDAERKEKYLRQIIDTYIKKDIRDLAEIREVKKFNDLLEVLAAQSGRLLNVFELANTCNLSKQTVEKYLFLLQETYIIRQVRPYSKNLRSELFKTPKIYFYDTGLMQMLWLKKIPVEMMGNVFETSVFSELAKNYGAENIYFWRTKDKKEIDFILNLNNNLIPIEVKLNFSQFSPAIFDYFKSKYKVNDLRYTALSGRKEKKEFYYPWDL